MKTYDPSQVIVIWGPIIFSGLTDDGDAITAEHDEDHATKKVGLGGEVARAMNMNRCGGVSVRLMATSMTNDELSAAAAVDRLDRSAVFPLTIKDLSGLTVFFTKSAWIKKIPQLTYAKEIGVREWPFDCGQIDTFIGGIIG